MAGQRDSGGVQSLERAAALLETIAAHPEGIGLAELAAKQGLHTSTAFNLVKTLNQLGFVAQVEDSRKYRIGSRLFSLAAGALDETVLLALGTPVLERLSKDTGEAGHLAVRSKSDIVVIAKTAASGLLQLGGRTGSTRPPHASAIGKMLLSAMPDQDLDKLLETLPMPAFTERTLTNPAQLRAEIETIRIQQLARDNRELDPDVQCVAVPVYDFAGRCVAAMGLSGPVWRFTPDYTDRMIAAVRAAAADLSAQLGARDAVPQALRA